MPSDTHNNLQIHHICSIYSNEQTLPRPLPLLVAWGVGEFLFIYFGKPFMQLRVPNISSTVCISRTTQSRSELPADLTGVNVKVG